MHGPLPARSGALALALAALLAPAFAQNTPERPRPYAVRGVRLSADEDAPRKTLLLRDGRIESIQDAELAVPPDAWLVEADGLVAVPAFVDAWSTLGVETPEPRIEQDAPADTTANVRVDMRRANRKGIQPAFRAADGLALEASGVEDHRKAGFGVVVAAPGGEILAGQSALVVLRDAPARDVVAADSVFQHAAFAARGGGYPGTLMGYHAQLRQLFLDARHHRELKARHEGRRPGPRPAWDEELEAVDGLLLGETTLVCEADDAPGVRRWLALGDELGLTVAIAGGRDAWKLADELAERGVAVLMDLDWGDEVDDPDEEEDEPDVEHEEDPEHEGEESEEEVEEPDGGGAGEGEAPEAEETSAEGDAGDEGEEAEEEEDGLDYDYAEPLGVLREKRRLWEERRDSATRLREAGARVVFCTGGGGPDELLERVRTLTENGFPRDAALAALTAQPAELVGADRHYGWLRPGHSATFCLWTDHPLAEGAQVQWSFVEGFPEEYEVEERGTGEGPDEGVDLTGVWRVRFDDDENRQEMTLTLEMAEDGTVTGDCRTKSPMDGSDLSASVTGRVEGDEVDLSMTFAVGGLSVELELGGEVDGDELEGDSTLKMPGNEMEGSFEAERLPDGGTSR